MVHYSSKDINARLHASSRENFINWRGSALRSGDNVLFISKTASCSIPGQIINIQDYHDILGLPHHVGNDFWYRYYITIGH
jgi:hypothetical protein